MGDNRRSQLFTNFIINNFHNSKLKVLAVADGNLLLSNQLIKFYQDITVYNPFMRAKKKTNKIKCFKKEFNGLKENVNCDIIVGMHPDEATGEIIDYAIKNRKPFVICPCCLKGKYADKTMNKQRWIKKLKTIAVNKNFDVIEAQLQMTGDNVCLRGLPND